MKTFQSIDEAVMRASLYLRDGWVSRRSVASGAGAGQPLVAKAVLADHRGGALTRYSLSATLNQDAATREQLVGETMRGGLDNWFADTTAQQITNHFLRER